MVPASSKAGASKVRGLNLQSLPAPVLERLSLPLLFWGRLTTKHSRKSLLAGKIENLLRIDGLNGLLGSGIFRPLPLKNLIARYADERLLDAIAVEHRK